MIIIYTKAEGKIPLNIIDLILTVCGIQWYQTCVIDKVFPIKFIHGKASRFSVRSTYFDVRYIP